MNKMHVEIAVNGTLEKVWKFWTEPERIKMWAFASDDWECSYAENDVVVGGTFVSTMSAKDKSASFDFSGTYTDVVQFEKIAYVMSKEVNDKEARTCEVLFQDMGDGTIKITETFDPENENSEEMQKAGWLGILGNFKKLVEASE